MSALVLCVVLGGLAADLVLADSNHDEIRQLRRANKILALERIIANHQRQYPGGILLEAELELEHGHYVYELKILGDDGVVREFEYDACNGKLWELESKQQQE
jgi:uncharacterized membrane protein YkoI